MTDSQRTIKRLFIILVYLAMFALIFYGVWLIAREKPTCFDGKRNQGEESIDCGGPCSGKCEEIPNIENIQVLQKTLIPAGTGRYDALVKIKNPNTLFGIAKLNYSLDFKDGGGTIIEKKEGSSFILPAETKYVAVFNVDLDKKPASTSFSVKSFRWQRFVEFEEPNIAVYGKELDFDPAGGNAVRLRAKIQNRSNYDFKKIITKVILRNSAGAPIAVNQTDSNDVQAGEEREVIFNWGTVASRDVDPQNIEIESEVDAFSNDNFMKEYGSSEQYQSYGADDLK